jgi:putative transposase
LKFNLDRRRWLEWLFQAKKRFGVSILNYAVTSNHIHLLVRDGQQGGVIPQAMQLIAGRTGQEYNRRKKRKGAFWEDRYHATVVETGEHLAQCMVYIDLNMVRAGVVTHPSEWPFSGYDEILRPRQRYGLINHEGLMEALDIGSMKELRKSYTEWVEESLRVRKEGQQPKWTKSIAVGSEMFVEKIKAELGSKAIGRQVTTKGGIYELREPDVSYNANSDVENSGLKPDNTYYWDMSP